MKKRILLFTAIAGVTYLSMTSSSTGAGHTSGFDCTGAETANSNGAGCSHGSCHSTAATTGATGIGIVLELDSAGTSITHYTPGNTYTVKITGTNHTANTLPKFGFQVTCIKGSAAAGTPTNAGTFATVSTPLRNTPATTNFVCNLVEHSTTIAATTLGGATGATYVESFQWTSPAVGTGTVSFWGALNAVDGDGDAGAPDKWNTTNLVITEAHLHTAGVSGISGNISIKAFPNPVSSNLNLQIDNAQAGSYSVQVYDLSGRNISSETIEVNGTTLTNINTNNWQPGVYQVAIEKDGSYQLTSVVKM